jgi:hypothetical protein
MLQPTGQHQHIRRLFQPQQLVVRHVQIHLAGVRLGHWEERVECPLAEHVPHERRHRVFGLGTGTGTG